MVMIIRAESNKQIAVKLGLTADELADRLARPDHNQGTNLRVTDEEFDDLMAELGLSGDDARARFRGDYW
jgi:hypothetical protein